LQILFHDISYRWVSGGETASSRVGLSSGRSNNPVHASSTVSDSMKLRFKAAISDHLFTDASDLTEIKGSHSMKMSHQLVM
jgi:hypothetical protein